LFPKEVESDKRLAFDPRLVKQNPARAESAKNRLALAVQVASFDQEVVLHREDRGAHAHGTGERGEQTVPRWRTGHWARQPFGTKVKDEDGRWRWKPENRRLIFRPPVLTRADLFVGDVADTSVTIKG
jgi:hypothetical protein